MTSPAERGVTALRWSRRDLLRGAGVAALALGGSGLVAGCSSATGEAGALDRFRSAGRVRVGFANEAPYGFRDANGNLTGSAPEVAREIFRRLGVAELEPVLIESFDALIDGLVAGQYDVMAAGMFINRDRCERILFSDPDYCARTAFLVRTGGRRELATFDDIAGSPGSRLGVIADAAEQTYATERGVTSGQIETFADAQGAFHGLLRKKVDAVALTDFTLRWTLQDRKYSGEPLKVMEPFVHGKQENNCGGYGFRKSDAELVRLFNAELKKLRGSGRLLEIVEPFGFDKGSLDAAKAVTAAEACAA